MPTLKWSDTSIAYRQYRVSARVPTQWRIQGGGGGSRGSGPPLLGHDVGFLTLGPKLDPPLLWMSKSGGVFQFFWGRMTSHGQCPRGGGCACECPRVGVFFKFSEVGWRHMSNVQGGGVLVKNPVSAPGPPPPFQKSWIRACLHGILPFLPVEPCPIATKARAIVRDAQNL